MPLENVMAYEDHTIMVPLLKAMQSSMTDGDRLIFRSAFRWKEIRKDEQIISPLYDCGSVLCNMYEMFSLDSVAESMGVEVVYDFAQAAIVRNS